MGGCNGGSRIFCSLEACRGRGSCGSLQRPCEESPERGGTPSARRIGECRLTKIFEGGACIFDGIVQQSRNSFFLNYIGHSRGRPEKTHR